MASSSLPPKDQPLPSTDLPVLAKAPEPIAKHPGPAAQTTMGSGPLTASSALEVAASVAPVGEEDRMGLDPAAVSAIAAPLRPASPLREPGSAAPSSLPEVAASVAPVGEGGNAEPGFQVVEIMGGCTAFAHVERSTVQEVVEVDSSATFASDAEGRETSKASDLSGTEAASDAGSWVDVGPGGKGGKGGGGGGAGGRGSLLSVASSSAAAAPAAAPQAARRNRATKDSQLRTRKTCGAEDHWRRMEGKRLQPKLTAEEKKRKDTVAEKADVEAGRQSYDWEHICLTCVAARDGVDEAEAYRGLLGKR